MSNTFKKIKIVLISAVAYVALILLPDSSAFTDPKTGSEYYVSVLLKPIAMRRDGEPRLRSWFCAASVINKHVLLTAAHCVEFRDKPSAIMVLYQDVCHSRNITIGIYKIHENYNPDTKANDIALLVTTSPMEYSNTCKVRRLLLLNNSLPRQVSTAHGWQIIDKTKQCEYAYVRFFQEKVKSRKCCRRYTHNVPRGTFCVLPKDNTTLYDSAGGPVIVQNYIQIGLTSVREITKYGEIIIITNTTYFHHWISENSKMVYCNWVKSRCNCKGVQCKHLVVLQKNPSWSYNENLPIRPPQLINH